MRANGDTIEDLLAAYPSISREDVLGCLEYMGIQIGSGSQTIQLRG